jgi:hypothetical protein
MAAPNSSAPDRRTVDRDGFVIGCDRPMFGQRPSVGGLSACVQAGDRVGVIVGLDTDPDRPGLLLHLVWLPDHNTSQRARNRAMRAYQRGEVDSEPVPAEGLIALDAYLPDDPEPARLSPIVAVEDEYARYANVDLTRDELAAAARLAAIVAKGRASAAWRLPDDPGDDEPA